MRRIDGLFASDVWRNFFTKKTLEGNNYFDAAAVWPSNPHAQMPNYQQHRPDRTPLRVRVCVRAVRADEGESRVRVVSVCVCQNGGRSSVGLKYKLRGCFFTSKSPMS